MKLKESTKQDLIWLGILAAVILAVVLVNVLDNRIWHRVDVVPGIEKHLDLIDSKEEFDKKYAGESYEEYDENFFKTKAIISVNQITGDPGVINSISKVYVENDTLYIEFFVKTRRGSFPQVISGWCSFVTVNKSDIKNVKYVKAVYI
ncbi:MAG: hypothetical protein IKC35_01520 [Clostridia bacterium]|nr:hypothetical protein [Clostridia bacterium]